jgi:hypothetical protein
VEFEKPRALFDDQTFEGNCNVDTGSVSSSSTGDTTRDESPQEENDSGDQENSTSDDESEQETAQQRRTVFGHETNLDMRGQTQPSGDSNTVALECLTE